MRKIGGMLVVVFLLFFFIGLSTVGADDHAYNFNIFGLYDNGTVKQYVHKHPEPGSENWLHTSGIEMPEISNQSFKTIVAAGGFYGIKANGDLYHSGRTAHDTWEEYRVPVQFKKIGTGWGNFQALTINPRFRTYDYVYGILPNGDLRWYGYDRSSDSWKGGHNIGTGWNSFIDIVAIHAWSSSEKKMYIAGLTENGQLKIYEHNDPIGGSKDWGRIETMFEWPQYTDIDGGQYSGRRGVLYAQKWNGELFLYKYDSHDIFNKSKWSNAIKVGQGWNFKQISFYR